MIAVRLIAGRKGRFTGDKRVADDAAGNAGAPAACAAVKLASRLDSAIA